MKRVFVVSHWLHSRYVFFLLQEMKFTFVGSKVYILTLGPFHVDDVQQFFPYICCEFFLLFRKDFGVHKSSKMMCAVSIFGVYMIWHHKYRQYFY